MRLRNQLVVAAKNFARKENLSSVLIPTPSKDTDEQLNLAHKVVDVVYRANRNNCVSLLLYSVDELASSYVEVQFFSRRKENEKFQQVVYANSKLEKIIYLFDIRNSVFDNVIANERICISYKK